MNTPKKTKQKKPSFNKARFSKYWDDWQFIGDKGRQSWKYNPPTFIKQLLQSKSTKNSSEHSWKHPKAKEYLKSMDLCFHFDKQKNPNSADQVYRHHRDKTTKHKLLTPSSTLLKRKTHKQTKLNQDVYKSIYNGFSYYETLQTDHGNWPGDYGGPLFLMPGLVFAAHITETPFQAPEEVLLRRNMLNHQNKDGGWGLHIEGESTMFGTVTQYVSLRLLGLEPQNHQLEKARKWISQNGGATYIPAWGKFYLSTLNLYEWQGSDSLIPELWVTPRWLPIHPGKYWCHNRMVYLGMAYCYGHRVTAKLTPLIQSIRKEIYPESEPYDKVNWKKARRRIAKADQFHPVHRIYKTFIKLINFYEDLNLPIVKKYLRKKALKFITRYIDHEDIHTKFINIGPVNQAINSICVWHQHGKDSNQFQSHLKRWREYLWVAEDGMKMGGYNGSQLWDAAFTGQALLECRLENEFPTMAKKLYHFIEQTQIPHDPVAHNTYFRDKSKGCWPFSTVEHAWPVTDCTAEGMKTSLMYVHRPLIKKSNLEKIGLERLKPTVDWLLNMQNKNGGWASYEKQRAPRWIEVLNPASVFENIMVEVCYPECSSASMQGLNCFTTHYPKYRQAEIKKAIKRGVEFIKSQQQADGSWYGSWGVCFTYGTWFGIEGLINGGEAGYDDADYRPVSKAIAKACEFLKSIQKPDGSWGEHFHSCVTHKYTEHPDGQIINTAWALLALMSANFLDAQVIEAGVKFLIKRQDKNGDFPQEAISGVFNGNCMETYTSYRNVFPLWALGRYLNDYSKSNKTS